MFCSLLGTGTAAEINEDLKQGLGHWAAGLWSVETPSGFQRSERLLAQSDTRELRVWVLEGHWLEVPDWGSDSSRRAWGEECSGQGDDMLEPIPQTLNSET